MCVNELRERLILKSWGDLLLMFDRERFKIHNFTTYYIVSVINIIGGNNLDFISGIYILA
jgi:hypothetical protein